MRRFNLVTMDLRGYGWTLAKVDDTYGREVAAQDVLNLMVLRYLYFPDSSSIHFGFAGRLKHLRMPCHGRLHRSLRCTADGHPSSRKSAVALYALACSTHGGTPAILFDYILNICSFLSSWRVYKPEESTEGRQEIHDYWTQGFRNPNGIDYTALEDAVMGALQLAYNNKETRLTKA
jgi:hypothetical protein